MEPFHCGGDGVGGSVGGVVVVVGVTHTHTHTHMHTHSPLYINIGEENHVSHFAPGNTMIIVY